MEKTKKVAKQIVLLFLVFSTAITAVFVINPVEVGAGTNGYNIRVTVHVTDSNNNMEATDWSFIKVYTYGSNGQNTGEKGELTLSDANTTANMFKATGTYVYYGITATNELPYKAQVKGDMMDINSTKDDDDLSFGFWYEFAVQKTDGSWKKVTSEHVTIEGDGEGGGATVDIFDVKADIFDIKNVLSNISFENGTIKGPTINILGKELCLFEADIATEIPILKNSSFTIDTKNKKIKVLIGVKDTQSAEMGPQSSDNAYWSKSYQNIKSMYKSVTGKNVDTTKLWNQFSSVRGSLKKINGKMGFDCNAYLAGYAEFSYASGNVVFKEGGMIAEAGLGATITSRVPWAPAIYTKFGLSGDIDGKLTFKNQGSLSYNGTVSGKITGSFAIGAGFQNVKYDTYIEGRMEASLNASLKMPSTSMRESFKLNMTGTLFAEAYGLGFELYSDEWEFPNIQLYPTSKSRSASLYNSTSEINAVPLERDYTNDNSELTIEEYTFEKDDIYAYNAPMLVDMSGDTQLLVWTDDNASKNDINRTSLYYSYFNGSAWSVPALVDDDNDGFTNGAYVVSDGEKAYIIWQKANAQAADATYLDVAANMELYYTSFDGNDFSQPVQLTNNDIYESMYSLTVSNGKIIATWIEEAELDVVSTSKGSSIMCADVTDISNVVTTCEYTAVNYIAEVTTTVNEDNIEIYFVEYDDDGNNDLNKCADNTATLLHTSGEPITGLNYHNNGLLFIESDNLKHIDEEGNVASLNLGSITNYKLISSDNYTSIVTRVDGKDAGSMLMVSNFDGTTWSEFLPIVDDGRYIRNYSPVFDENGKLQIAINAVAYNENPEADGLYGKATLYVLNGSNYFDLVMGDYIKYDEENVKSGAQLPVSFSVANNSMTEINKINVTFTDELTGEKQSKALDVSIAACETVEVSTDFILPENMTKREISISISSDEFVETDITNNNYSTEIGYADLSIDNVEYICVDGDYKVKFDLNNIGVDETGNITVSLKNSSSEDEIISSSQYDSLANGETVTVVAQIPDDMIITNDAEIFFSLTVTAECENLEVKFHNNEIELVYQNFKDYEITDTEHVIVIDEAIEATCTESGLTEGKHCSLCNAVLVAQEAIPATGEHIDADNDFVCDYCDTDLSSGDIVVPDENCSHLDEDTNGICDNCNYDFTSDCDHLCHKDGFVGFFWKIIRLFWKLFKMNPLCECGMAHY